MNPVGQLKVSARFAAGAITALDVKLERPAVTRMFIGQNPAAVLKAVPVLYSLCSRAQAAAAQAACAAALGQGAGARDDRVLWLEFLHENFWRLLLDWPQALGLPSAGAEFAAWRAQRSGENCLAATRALLNGTLQELQKKCLQKLVDRNDFAAASLPEFQPEAWLAFWRGEDVAAPLVPRPASIANALHQRHAELEAATQALEAGQPYPCVAAGGEAWGVGQTLTARGVLTHAVHLQDNQVEKYQIWAPTDCHFADPAGLVALTEGQLFATLEEARSALKLAVLALDPCLPYEVELIHA